MKSAWVISYMLLMLSSLVFVVISFFFFNSYFFIKGLMNWSNGISTQGVHNLGSQVIKVFKKKFRGCNKFFLGF